MDNPLTFENLLVWSGARHVLGRRMDHVRGISTDSRIVNSGEVFIALKGPHFDAHDYLEEAISRGASGILIEKDLMPEELDRYRRKSLAVGKVNNTLQAIQDISKEYRKYFQIPIVAVTGSCGKTSAKEMIHSLLELKGPALKTQGTQNNHLGLPLTLLNLCQEHQSGCVELGTSSPGEIRTLAQIANPEIGVVLNVGPAHLRQLVDLDGVLEEKWSLIEHASVHTGIYNCDDLKLRERAAHTTGKRMLTFGIYQAADIRASKIEFLGLERTRFSVFFRDEEVGQTEVPWMGIHHVYNALAALCVGYVMQLDWASMLERAAHFKLPSMRWEIRKVNHVTLINDSYNANPSSMSAAISAFASVKSAGKKILVCADMLDLGSHEIFWHRQLIPQIQAAGIDIFISVGALSKVVGDGLIAQGMDRAAVMACQDMDDAAEQLRNSVQGHDIVLIKGSRAMGLEKILLSLEDRLKRQNGPALALYI